MKRRNVARIRRSSPSNTFDRHKVPMLLVSVICVAVVAAGFFFAARQHFATMEFGLKNSQLRKQVENLEAERRRLLLAKEVSLSPVSIKETASKLGFREQIVAPPSRAETRVDASTERTAPSAEHASFKPERESAAAIREIKKEEKKLVKQIVQQTSAKVRSSDERPRLAPTQNTVAAVSAKPSAKLR